MRKSIFAILILAALLLVGCEIELAEAPTITYSGVDGAVMVFMSTSVKKAEIRYTLDGTNPGVDSTLFVGPAVGVVENKTVKAIAVKGNKIVSEMAVVDVHVRVQKPTSNVQDGTYESSITVQLSHVVGSTIHFTANGDTPTAQSPECTEDIVVDRNTTIKAIAAKENMDDSEVLELDIKIKPAAPTASLSGGSYVGFQNVELSCSTAGATIHYTTDGSTPAEESAEYSEAILIDRSMTLKAVAVKDGCEISDVLSVDYTITSATPYASLPAMTYTDYCIISLQCAASDAEIRYTTDGTTPTATSSVYTTCFKFVKSTTLKAVAVKDGLVISDVMTMAYNIKPATPTASLSGGSFVGFQNVELSCTTTDAVIHYTTDGSTPTEESAEYSEAVLVDRSMTLKAVAVKEGCKVSDVLSVDYSIISATPAASPAGGSYYGFQYVELSSAASNAVIHYTTDGSTPTISSLVFSETVFVGESMTLKAIAVNDGNIISDIMTADYTISSARPVPNVASGTYDSAKTVGLICPPDATVYYTTDGTAPTASSTPYSDYIIVDRNMTIKAVSVRNGRVVSDELVIDLKIKSAKPVSSVEAGSYLLQQEIKLTSAENGAIIYYTTDGTTPTTTTKSSVYSSPITVSTDTTIKAISVVEGCEPSDVVEFEYEIGFEYGAIGPAGGYVFYDCDADNDSGNADGLKSTECGWRYLEAAPNDIYVENSLYRSNFCFGCAMDTEEGNFIDGDTSRSIGSGKSNTEKLVAAFGEAVYEYDSTEAEMTSNYAARLCYLYVYGGYDDWFLPSIDELELVYTNLKLNGIGGFRESSYWSSSEASGGHNALEFNFSKGSFGYGARGNLDFLRPIRMI